jgi:hypothetical protein
MEGYITIFDSEGQNTKRLSLFQYKLYASLEVQKTEKEEFSKEKHEI